MIVVIDGPSAAGKSTVARLLARRMNATYLDTGAMYRALTWLALERGVALDDETALGALAYGLALTISPGVGAEPDRFALAGRDVTDDLRTPSVTGAVSKVSAHPAVRTALVDAQRKLASEGDWVADGRDLGSVVWPQADLKIFLTAAVEERARRRHREFLARGIRSDYDDVLNELRRRDRHDSERAVAPLTIAPDAAVIDCSDDDAEGVVARIAALAAQLP